MTRKKSPKQMIEQLDRAVDVIEESWQLFQDLPNDSPCKPHHTTVHNSHQDAQFAVAKVMSLLRDVSDE